MVQSFLVISIVIFLKLLRQQQTAFFAGRLLVELSISGDNFLILHGVLQRGLF